LLLEEVVLLVESKEEATVARVVDLLKAAGVTEIVSVRDNAAERENEVVRIHTAGVVETTAGTLLIVIVVVPRRLVLYALSVSLVTVISLITMTVLVMTIVSRFCIGVLTSKGLI
jgi:hypothetical protein